MIIHDTHRHRHRPKNTFFYSEDNKIIKSTILHLLKLYKHACCVYEAHVSLKKAEAIVLSKRQFDAQEHAIQGELTSIPN